MEELETRPKANSRLNPNCFAKNNLGEIVAWRIAAAVFWSIVSQCLLIIVMRILFAVDIDWYPTSWIQSNESIIRHTPLYLIPLGAISLVHSLILTKHINGYGNICKKYNRFSAALNIFTVHSLLLCIAHICTGGLFFWLYLLLVNGPYGQFSSACTIVVDSNCLVESHLYLVLSGVWTGMFLFTKYVISSETNGLLNFSSVQQRKYRHVTTELLPTLVQSLYDSILPSLLYVLVYFWFGNSVREICCDFFNLPFEDHARHIISISNVTRVAYSWVLSSLYMFTINMLELLLQVFLMQHITFAIIPMFGSLNSLTLSQVLKVEEIRIMHHLGYLDLMLLAGRDKIRRKELFSLSQPGGHPYNWNAILGESLQLVNTFTADLNMWLNMANNDNQLEPEVPESRKIITCTSRQTENTPVNSSIPGLRNLSMQRVIDLNQSAASVSCRTRRRPANTFDVLKLQVDKLQKKLRKNYMFVFLFGELHEKRLRHILLAKGQLVMWATQSLALLASASFEEDNYGVVQKDLSSIITALLQLKKILDKLQKAGSYKKPNGTDKFGIKMKSSLRSAVKRSLYRITVTFGQYVNDLPLSNDALQQMSNFVMFKEG